MDVMAGAVADEGHGAEDRDEVDASSQRVREWDTRPCQACKRRRVHGRIDGQGWVCIGKLKARKWAKECGA